MSSVKGMQISGLDKVNEIELLDKIQSTLADAVNISRREEILAGSASVKAGWKVNTKVDLKLQGSGSLFSLEGIHLHLFP